MTRPLPHRSEFRCAPDGFAIVSETRALLKLERAQARRYWMAGAVCVAIITASTWYAAAHGAMWFL